jgi:gliding motility-associated-like protein
VPTAKAQLYSTVGKEFWVSFPQGSNVFGFVATPIIYITGSKNCTGTVQDKSGTYSQKFTVTPGQQTILELSSQLFYVDNYETIEQKGAFIQSSDSIQVFIFSGTGKVVEFANAIPIQSLGSDYMVNTYAYGGLNVGRSFSQFMLLGVEDGTEVDITPSQQSKLGTLAATFTITLNKGETYLYQGDRDLDLTGSMIHAKNCKKLIVYSGTRQTGIPSACNNYISQYPLFEQSAPLNTLGTNFLVTCSPLVEKEYLKILATQNNTKVYINGVLLAVLNSGGYYEGYFNEPSYIKTNKPVITAYMGLSLCRTTQTSQKYNGEFLILETPLEQAIQTSTIITENTPPIVSKQFVQIHIRTKDKDLTFMDGQNIGDKFKIFPSNPEYAYAQVEIFTGAHTLKNNNGFTADVTGLSDKTSGTSYGYSAGSLLNKSNQYASVNGNSSNLQKEFLFCPKQAVNFEAVRQDTVFSKVFWHFDDGSIDSGNVVNKTFKDTGCHQVQMISYYSGSSGNCLLGNGATDTTFLKVCVVNSLPLSIGNDTGFCRNRPLTLQSNINPDGFSYLWSTGATSSAISVTETGNYWLELKNGNCAIRDSVQVTVVDKPVLSIQGDKLLCSGDSILLQNSVNSPTVTYTWNNGKKGFSQWINKPGLYSLSGIDRGCYAETSINIGELSCPEIYVPTGFTPDGDGRNDIIRPICAGIDLVYFRVYNRFGQMIFETREDGKGWNGKLNGIQQSMATYVYVVEGRDKSGRQHIRKGTFVLIR